MKGLQTALLAALALAPLTACGTLVPGKHLLSTDTRVNDPTKPDFGQSSEGRAEANIIANIRCEIQNGIYAASQIKHDGKYNVPYLYSTWGTQVTLNLTWEEQSSFTPGISIKRPLSNSQSKAIGVGGSASAHATRKETVTFLFANADLYASARDWLDKSKTLPDCKGRETGTMIDSDLKIADFIVDKATLASTGISSTNDPSEPPFSTFQEDITFVGAYGFDFTPTWTLTRFSANGDGKLVGAIRTTTGDVLITLGPLAPDPANPGHYLHKLGELAQAQHIAAIGGGATAGQIKSQSRQ